MRTENTILIKEKMEGIIKVVLNDSSIIEL